MSPERSWGHRGVGRQTGLSRLVGWWPRLTRRRDGGTRRGERGEGGKRLGYSGKEESGVCQILEW